MIRGKANGKPKAVRCAIYTRKSTEEGLEQEFNSLDAQRESSEAFIKSQAHEGWICIPDHYDDGGFTGGNMDRPALKRLLADIAAGRVDVVVCYKIDRLSRSLLDFSRLLEMFEKYSVAFVSITQRFDTTTSMGRLTLNILMSFAEFERQMVSERTRDKIAATRRKGKWSGGHPVLGYDVVDMKLVPNQTEASRVRQIFDLYVEHQSITKVLRELERRGWTTKGWTTKKGTQAGGKPFDKPTLHGLLRNVLYFGKVRYKDEVHAGEHPGIVEPAIFDKVQYIIQKNRRNGGSDVRNEFGALLRGLLRCAPCNASMVSTQVTKRGKTRYRYYTCLQAQKRGWSKCPTKAISAPEIERFVIDQIRCIGRDPGVVAETLAQARHQGERQIAELKQEQLGLEADLCRHHAEVRTLVAQGGKAGEDRLADLQDQIAKAEPRVTALREEIETIRRGMIDEAELTAALAQFDPVWEHLSHREQSRVLQLLVERVEYDGRTGEIAITFHPAGIKTLVQEVQEEETAA